jgi:hypothetical protein
MSILSCWLGSLADYASLIRPTRADDRRLRAARSDNNDNNNRYATLRMQQQYDIDARVLHCERREPAVPLQDDAAPGASSSRIIACAHVVAASIKQHLVIPLLWNSQRKRWVSLRSTHPTRACAIPPRSRLVGSLDIKAVHCCAGRDPYMMSPFSVV